MILNQLVMINTASITIDRDHRQREELDDTNILDIAADLTLRPLINPIIVEELSMNNYRLIAGEHRLNAFLTNAKDEVECDWADYEGWKYIPARIVVTPTQSDRMGIELAENIRRSELKWKDYARAVRSYHLAQAADEPSWTMEQTSRFLNIKAHKTSMCLMVAQELDSGNALLDSASSVDSAYNILRRKQDRAIAAEVELLGQTIHVEQEASLPEVPIDLDLADGAPESGATVQRIVTPAQPVASILNEDFREFSSSYLGPKFNFLHCDFPYGINMQNSAQGRSAQYGGYQDDPDVYWRLLGALAKSREQLIAPNAHILFWFSMNYYSETLTYFAKNMPEWSIDPFPLIWHKSDGKGILPDPKRGPRRIYETAFLISIGDRQVVQPVSNTYSGPMGSKKLHQSEKSEAMLRHFFRMFVDEYTIMLDPTCGSGSSVRAALALGAKTSLGLELNPEFHEDANNALARSIKLKALSEES